MADKLIRAIAANGGIRAVGAITTKLTEEARGRHKLSNVATAALGRGMTASLLLASSLKKPGSRLILRLKGDGPMGGLLVDAGLDGTVRGYVDNPRVELPPSAKGKLDVGRAIGSNGFLRVIRDEKYGTPYEGTVELISGEVGEDVNYYLAKSEQTESALLVGVYVGSVTGVTAAGGILLQVMPESRPDDLSIARLESRVSKLPAFTTMMREGRTLEDIFQELMGDMGLEIVPEVRLLRFDCRCSFDRVLNALKLLGVDELQDMIEKDKQAEVTCDFCGDVYNASEAQLIELVESLRSRQEGVI